jgi:hypothetical protein
MEEIKSKLVVSKGQEYLDLKASLDNEKKSILSITGSIPVLKKVVLNRPYWSPALHGFS